MEQSGKTLGIILASAWGLIDNVRQGIASCDWLGFFQSIFVALLFGGIGWLGGYLMQLLVKGKKTKK